VKYRREIDGLRAFAVVPVILFHGGFLNFSGGFVGVDVFFVISGYLITSILVTELENGDFSILRFYERRATRILPALFLVLFCCLPFAWMWMFPSQLEDFAQSLVAVVFFASNILFMKEEGYFAAAAELKPLLHTWSLAVEEQYYLVAPLFLLFLWRFGRRFVFWSVVVIALSSLLLSEWGWRYFANANFYLAPTRAWELLAGSICAFLALERKLKSNNWLSGAGLAMVVFSIFYYDHNTPFPSVYALAPVGGTALILLFGGNGSWVARLLSMQAFVGVGLISYSAYLWHQPLFAFARLLSITEPSKGLMASLAVMSMVLAYFSWRFVEQPFRKRPAPLLHSRRTIFGVSATVGAILVGFGLIGDMSNGFKWRLNGTLLALENSKNDHGNYRGACLTGNIRGLDNDTVCSLGVASRNAIDFVLIGDSFAGAIADAVNLAAVSSNSRGALYATHGCPAILGVGGTYKPTTKICEALQDEMVEKVAAVGARRVLLSSSWKILDEENVCQLSRIECANSLKNTQKYVSKVINNTINAFQEKGIEVVFIGDPPSTKLDVIIEMQKLQKFHGIDYLYNKKATSYPSFFTKSVSLNMEKILYYVDISDFFCDQYICYLGKNGIPFFYDGSHITGSVSLKLFRYFLDSVSDFDTNNDTGLQTHSDY